MNRKTGIWIAALLILALMTASCGSSEKEAEPSDVSAEVITASSGTAVPMEAPEEEPEESVSVSEEPEAEEISEESEPEEEKENGHIVCIDPGHSSVMPSFSSEPIGPGSSEYKAADASGTHGNASGLAEYELTMQISLALREELISRGYTVFLTREDNLTAVSCAERAAVAADTDSEIFVRIHANGSGNPGAKGAMGLCITPNNAFHPELYEASRMLTEDILAAYCEVTGIENTGGIWETDTMSGNNWSTVPAMILEMGFMTNPEEDLWMADPENQVLMVKGIADGIDRYFEHALSPDGADKQPEEAETEAEGGEEAGTDSTAESEEEP